MPKQIFDQDRPRSTMAQRLDEAFAGCEEWTLAPPSQRRSSIGLSPRSSSVARMLGRAPAVPIQEPGAL
jgi:hypothetical protein